MGKTYYNYSTPIVPETAQTKRHRPAHRKSRTKIVAVACGSMLAGALATTGVAFALSPVLLGQANLGLVGEAHATSAAPAAQVVAADQSKGALADGPRSPYPVKRQASVTIEPAAAESTSEVVNSTSEPSGAEAIWHEGWTETIVHPAVTESIPSYTSYICTDGYESIDLDDMEAHIEETGAEGYDIVENDCPDVVLEEEWTEVIEHAGYWE